MLFHEAAVRVGAHAAACERLYELLARWSGDPDLAAASARATRLLGETASHQAWHAQLWSERLPVAYVDVVPTIDVAEADDLTAAVGIDAGEARIDATIRLIARRIAAYDDDLVRTSPAGDGPMLRALELARRDCVEDLARLAATRVRLG